MGDAHTQFIFGYRRSLSLIFHFSIFTQINNKSFPLIYTFPHPGFPLSNFGKKREVKKSDFSTIFCRDFSAKKSAVSTVSGVIPYFNALYYYYYNIYILA